MSALTNLTIDTSIENESDSIGYSGALESNVYLATITLAYVMKSAGGATGLVINAKTAADQEIRQTLWVTSGTAKGGKNYYERDGKKNYLPGFLQAQALSLLTIGKDISDVETEVKVVNAYNSDTKSEIPTKVDMLVDLLGKEIYIGLLKQKVDRTAKNDAGVYVPTGETREENVIDKLFRASDKLTTSEIRAQSTSPVFFDTWTDKWEGITRDRSTSASGGAKSPVASVATSKKPATSLFS